jgi:sulfite exporter TauE/SafE
VALAISLFVMGVAAGVHCVGMCGGFVAAFQGIPIRKAPAPRWTRLALFNAGRVTTYALLGAAAGAVGHQVSVVPGAQTALYIFANLMLIAVGLYLAGAASWFPFIEKLGNPFWRRVQPLAAKAMRRGSAYVAGLCWGLLPCGLVYGALAAAAFAGSAQGGAGAMAAYGIGTLPWLLGAGVLFSWLQQRAVRALAGGVVLAFGVFGLAHANNMAGGIRALLCL